MTGDKRANFATKRLLPRDALDDQFFQYLQDQLLDIASRTWGSQRGVFGSASLAASGNDEFDVTTLPIDLIDGDGRILELAGTDGTNIRFQNTNAITYTVGAKFVETPSGVSRNPRNDVISYDSWEDAIGVADDPDDVTEGSGVLDIIVDSIFEAGVSNAGRLVTVYLKEPVTDVEADAIERNLVVTWDGSNNIITTSGLLGQQGGSASEVESDYTVIAQGVAVRRNTNLAVTDPYAFIGTVTGGGAGNPPSGTSTAGQIDVTDGINPDLQEAYSAGRTIAPSSADGGSVRIATTDSGDNMRAALQVDRQGSTEDHSSGVVTIADEGDGANVVHLHPLSFSGAVLNVGEAAQLVGAVPGSLNLTRGGSLDLTDANLNPTTDVVLLSGFPDPDNNHLYLIDSIGGADQLQLMELDGSTPSPWVNLDSGTATFYRIRTKVGHPSWTDIQKGHVFLSGENEAINDSVVFEIYPEQSEDAIVSWDNNTTRRKRFRLTAKGALVLDSVGSASKYEDGHNAQVRLVRLADTTTNAQFALVTMGDSNKAVPLAAFTRISRGTFGPDPTAQLTGTQTIDFTTSGFDPTSASLDARLHVAWIETEGAQYGLYRIKDGSITSNTFEVEAINGSLPGTWTGVRTVSVLEPKFVVGGNAPAAAPGLELWRGMLYSALNGSDTVRSINIVCADATVTGSLLRIFAAGQFKDNGAGVCIRIDQEGVMTIGDQWEAGSVQDQPPGGLHVYGRPRDTTDADKFGLHVWPSAFNTSGDLNLPIGSGRVAALYDGWENEILRWTQWGRMAQTPRLFDHFTEYLTGSQGKDANGNLANRWVLDDDSGNGLAEIISTSTFAKGSGGIFQLKTDANTNSSVNIHSPFNWTCKEGTTDIRRALSFACRIRLVGATDADALQEVTAHMVATRNANSVAGWRYIATGSNSSWVSYTTGGATTLTSTRTAATRGTNDSMDDGWMDFYFRLDFDLGVCLVWMTGMANTATQALANPTNSNWTGGMQFRIDLETTDNTAKELQVDWVDIWTDDMQDGASG